MIVYGCSAELLRSLYLVDLMQPIKLNLTFNSLYNRNVCDICLVMLSMNLLFVLVSLITASFMDDYIQAKSNKALRDYNKG